MSNNKLKAKDERAPRKKAIKRSPLTRMYGNLPSFDAPALRSWIIWKCSACGRRTTCEVCDEHAILTRREELVPFQIVRNIPHEMNTFTFYALSRAKVSRLFVMFAHLLAAPIELACVAPNVIVHYNITRPS